MGDFMKHQITGKEKWAKVDTKEGTQFVPIDQLGIDLPDYHEESEPKWLAECIGILRDYLPHSRVFSIETIEGY
jgi:hypothetical protein